MMWIKLLACTAGVGLLPMGCVQTETATGAACGATMSAHAIGAYTHVEDGTEVTYSSVPPCIGSHYGQWLRWGEYDTPLEPRNYTHNLEHGGVALFYNCPTGCASLLAELRAFAATWTDATGDSFRFLLAPFPSLNKQIAVVAWGQIYEADCFDEAGVTAFLDEHYRKGPEDVAAEGSVGSPISP